MPGARRPDTTVGHHRHADARPGGAGAASGPRTLAASCSAAHGCPDDGASATSPAPTSTVLAGERRITVPILPLSCASLGPGIYGYRIQALGADGQIVAQSELVAITAA